MERKFYQPSTPHENCFFSPFCLFQSLTLFTYFFLYGYNHRDYVFQLLKKSLYFALKIKPELTVFLKVLCSASGPSVSLWISWPELLGVSTCIENRDRGGRPTCSWCGGDRLLPPEARIVCLVILCTACASGGHVYLQEDSFYLESSVHRIEKSRTSELKVTQFRRNTSYLGDNSNKSS